MPPRQSLERRRAEESTRRRVVPAAAGRSLWGAAVWTGVGAAVLCAVVAVVVVAICWLPVSGPDSRSTSALHAGLLTFLAALHGGVTVDGVGVAFVPLGMVLLVGAVAWRAGAGLGDAASALGEDDPARLAVASTVQLAAFAASALVAVPFAAVGTSSAPFLGVAAGAVLLFAATGGTAFVLASPVRAQAIEFVPARLRRAAAQAAAVVTVHIGAGALLVGLALVAHYRDVEGISRQVGGGWGGLPILLLGVLAAPNAAIAGSAYLSGPGFAVGSATVSPFTTAHGVVPAFPLLGALPHGAAVSPVVWFLVAATPVVAGCCLARLVVLGTQGWRRRLADVGAAAVVTMVVTAVVAWLGGGGIGRGRLRTVGASPWQVGLSVAAESLVAALVALGAVAARDALRRDRLAAARPVALTRRLRAVGGARGDDGDRTEADELAG